MRSGAHLAIRIVVIGVLAASGAIMGSGAWAIFDATRLRGGDVGSIGGAEIELLFGVGFIGVGALLLVAGAVAYEKWARTRRAGRRR